MGYSSQGGSGGGFGEFSGHQISITIHDGEKKLFGTYGSNPRQFSCSRGVAIDTRENILVADGDS